MIYQLTLTFVILYLKLFVALIELLNFQNIISYYTQSNLIMKKQ